MLSRDTRVAAPVPSETEQSGDASRSQVRSEVRAISKATKTMVSGNADAQIRCDVIMSENMDRVAATREVIERSRRRLAEHTFYIA